MIDHIQVLCNDAPHPLMIDYDTRIRNLLFQFLIKIDFVFQFQRMLVKHGGSS